MKKSEVPQDDENIQEGKMGSGQVFYAVDDNGEYVKVQSLGWEPENVALTQAWELIHERMEEARALVNKNEASPILYYMEKNLMDVKLLAAHTGFWRWTVKRHMNPHVFNKLSERALLKYAQVFDITVPQLKQNPI